MRDRTLGRDNPEILTATQLLPQLRAQLSQAKKGRFGIQLSHSKAASIIAALEFIEATGRVKPT